MNGVLSYLPCPTEVSNYALDQTNDEDKVLRCGNSSQTLFFVSFSKSVWKITNSVILQVILGGTPDGPLVALAFKLEEGRFGQLTFLRYAMEVYVSTLTSV